MIVNLSQITFKMFKTFGKIHTINKLNNKVTESNPNQVFTHIPAIRLYRDVIYSSTLAAAFPLQKSGLAKSLLYLPGPVQFFLHNSIRRRCRKHLL